MSYAKNLNSEQFSILQRSAALLLAHAASNIFPDTILIHGGSHRVGFFFDFIFNQPLLPEALELIEREMKRLAKEDMEIRSTSMMSKNAIDYFEHLHQPILADQAEESDSNIIQLGQLDTTAIIIDHPLAESTKNLFSTKLLEIEAKAEITRIIGIISDNPQNLKQLNKSYEKWHHSNHQKLGPELKLFDVKNEGVFWFPRGVTLKKELMTVWQKENERLQVDQISTPICDKKLFLQHLELIETYNPLYSGQRLGECRQVIDAEKQGDYGLLDSLSYTADLVTSLCTKEEVVKELISSLQFINKTVRIFDFKVQCYLFASSREKELMEALKNSGLPYSEKKAGKNSLPVIEWHLEDSLGQSWLGPSVTLKRLADGRFAVGRSLFGSLDRWVALLIEHYEGQLPNWLVPEQIRVISVGMGCLDYAEQVVLQCKARGFKVGWDSRDEKLGTKIHAAEIERVPCVIIIGDKERSQKSVSVRLKHQQTRTMQLEDVLTSGELINDQKGIIEHLES